jgi:hypothetical protein
MGRNDMEPGAAHGGPIIAGLMNRREPMGALLRSIDGKDGGAPESGVSLASRTGELAQLRRASGKNGSGGTRSRKPGWLIRAGSSFTTSRGAGTRQSEQVSHNGRGGSRYGPRPIPVPATTFVSIDYSPDDLRTTLAGFPELVWGRRLFSVLRWWGIDRETSTGRTTYQHRSIVPIQSDPLALSDALDLISPIA